MVMTKRKVRRLLMKKSRKRIPLLALILLAVILPFVAATEITEVMFNPQGSDSGREWVEVDGPADNLTLIESGGAHVVSYYSGAGSVSVIADDPAMFLADNPGYSGLLYQSSWTALSNSGEEISIEENGTVVDAFDYSGLSSAEGESLQKVGDGWVSAAPSPGGVKQKSDEVPEFSTLTAAIALLASLVLVKVRKVPVDC